MQLHLYVPDQIAEAVQKKAEAQGIAVSRYLAELVQRDVGGDWPINYFEQVIGHWQGDPLARPEPGRLESRDSL